MCKEKIQFLINLNLASCVIKQVKLQKKKKKVATIYFLTKKVFLIL